MRRLLLTIFYLWVLTFPIHGQNAQMTIPTVVLNDVSFKISASGLPDSSKRVFVKIGDKSFPGAFKDGNWVFPDVAVTENGEADVQLFVDGTALSNAKTRAIPAWLSLLPPIIAIALAFITRAVVPALFVAIWFGAWAVNGLTFQGLLTGLLDSFQVYVLNTVINPDHAAIMLFSFMLGGMVGIISRNGGMQGIVNFAIRKADTPKKGQLSIWLLGILIFFDDYANTLIVGNTSRMLCDKLKISRQKLAYLVDSTAAPVSTIAIITTWIGFQVGLIADAIAGLEGVTESAYLLFLNSIPYSFYPLLAIFFVGLVVFRGLDFGPMHQAEVAARRGESSVAVVQSNSLMDEGDFEAKEKIPLKAINAVLPIITLVVGVMVGIYVTGEGENLQDIIGSSDSYAALMWATMLSVMVAAALSIGQRILTLNETFEAWYAGVKFMLMGITVLVLAWALADISDALHTADYIISALGETMSMAFLPPIIFLIAAVTAFGCGSSWGVMAILMPLVVPLCWAVMENSGGANAENMHILYSTIACVLCGAVWADHCSPISDTTILTSMATGCELMDHVRTQIPYALSGGIVALFICTIPAAFGAPWWLLLLLGMGLLFIILQVFGKKV